MPSTPSLTKSSLQAGRSALFLDRDGVIIRDFGYAFAKNQLELLPNVASTIADIKLRDFLVIVVTNQSGVARGYFSLPDVFAFHQWLQFELLNKGVVIDRFYFCPHHPEGIIKEFSINCNCRKPENTLLEQAIAAFGIDRSKSYFIGDKLSDIQCALKSHIKPVLVNKNGEGSQLPPNPKNQHSVICAYDLKDAWAKITN